MRMSIFRDSYETVTSFYDFAAANRGIFSELKHIPKDVYILKWLKNKNTKNCWLFSKPQTFGHLIPIEGLNSGTHIFS